MGSTRRRYRRQRRLIVAGLVVLVAAAGCGPKLSVGGEAGGAPAESLEDDAAKLQGYVADVWTRTGDIWPGVDFSDHVLLVSDGTDTWVVTTAEKTRVTQAELQANGASIPEQPGGFSFAAWDGHNAVIVRQSEPASQQENGTDESDDGLAIMRVSDPALDVFGTATHESFHNYVQQADPPWPLQPEQGTRAEPYPLVAEPRVQRTMIFNSLLAAYREPEQRQDHLAAAAYWNEQWTNEFPDEAANISENDLKEGTAEYFERVAVWMAHVDDPAEIAARKRDFLDKLTPLTHRNPLDIESYLVGLMAMLNSEDMDLPEAKSAIAAGSTPLSIVLAGVQPNPAGATHPDPGPDHRRDGPDQPAARRTDRPFIEAVNDTSQWTLMPACSPAGSTAQQPSRTRSSPTLRGHGSSGHGTH